MKKVNLTEMPLLLTLSAEKQVEEMFADLKRYPDGVDWESVEAKQLLTIRDKVSIKLKILYS